MNFYNSNHYIILNLIIALTIVLTSLIIYDKLRSSVKPSNVFTPSLSPLSGGF
jgi:hypothetical protein